MGTQFVSNKSLTFDCDFDCGNLNFVHDTLSHFASPLLVFEEWLTHDL